MQSRAFAICQSRGIADVCLLTGEEALGLPDEYVVRGGKTGDHDPGNDDYRCKRRSALLESMLREHLASPERWLGLFNRTAIPVP